MNVGCDFLFLQVLIPIIIEVVDLNHLIKKSSLVSLEFDSTLLSLSVPDIFAVLSLLFSCKFCPVNSVGVDIIFGHLSIPISILVRGYLFILVSKLSLLPRILEFKNTGMTRGWLMTALRYLF